MIPAGSKSARRAGSVTIIVSPKDRHHHKKKKQKSPSQITHTFSATIRDTATTGPKRSPLSRKDLAPRPMHAVGRLQQALLVIERCRHHQWPPSSGCPDAAADAGFRAGLRCRSLVLSCCFGRPVATVGVLLALVSGAVCTTGRINNAREQVPDKPPLLQPWHQSPQDAMSKETPHPACHPIRIDLTVTPLFGAVRGRSEEEELAAQVALDVSMIGDLADDQELCVLADFDSGAIRLWQEPPGSRGRPLVPLGLCPGEHSVSAWAITPFESPSTSATTTFTIGNAAATSAVLLDGGVGEKNCDSAERQPPLLIAGAKGLAVEHGKLCRVCPDILDGYPPSGSSPASTPPRIQQEQQERHPRRRRLVLRTSLRATFAGDTGEGQVEKEWSIELRQGDSAASAARDFVQSRLGLDVRPEGNTTSEVRQGATGSDAGGGQHGVGQDDGRNAVEEEGERVVHWVTQRLEAELAERQTRRSVARAEATRTNSDTGQLRVVLGSGPKEGAPEQGGWLITDINTLDVTDPAEFESLLGTDGRVDAFLAEHVWEHLSLEDAHRAARNCHEYLHPGGRLRLAVPDPAWFTSASASAPDVVITDVTGGHATAGHRRTDAHPAVNPMLNSDAKCTQGCAANSGYSVDGDAAPGQHAREEAGVDGGRTIHRLSSWLSRDMLAADARDGHLVQFTPELLANVCWSAGFFPVLVEGGGGSQAVYQRPSAVAKTETVTQQSFTARAGGGGGGAHGGEQEAAGFPTETSSSTGVNSANAKAGNLWGRVKRSIAGGDPRGAVSIVMDCIKSGGEEEREYLEQWYGMTGPDHQTPSNDKQRRGRSVANVGLESPLLPSREGLVAAVGSEDGIVSKVDTIRGGVAIVNGEAASTGVSSGSDKNLPRAIEHGRASGEGKLADEVAVDQCSTLFGDDSGPRRDSADSRKGGCGLPISYPRLDQTYTDEGFIRSTQQQPDNAHSGTKRETKDNANHGGQQQDPSNQTGSPVTGPECSSNNSGSSSSSGGNGGRSFETGDGISVDASLSEEEFYCSLSRRKRQAILNPGDRTEPNPSLTPAPEKILNQEDGEEMQATTVTVAARAGSNGEHVTAAGRTDDVDPSTPLPIPLLLDDGATTVFSDRAGLPVKDPTGLPACDNATYPNRTSSKSGVVDVDDDDVPSGSGVTEGVEKESRPIPDEGERRRRQQESLKEWAAAARKSGRVDRELEDGDVRLAEKLDPSSSAERAKANLTTAAETVDSIDRNPNQRRLEDLASTRARARKSLLGDNITATLEVCQTILAESPSDGVTLLYQGAAFAQVGQWQLASDNMKRVLAVSCGAETNNEAATTVRDRGDCSHEGEGEEGVSTERRHQDDAVPLDITLAAAANLASFAHERVLDTLDFNAELFFLVEGLRGAAEREKKIEKNDAGQETTVVSIGGFCDLLVMAARALEDVGQLTSALRLYQRVVLLGGHNDQRVLLGLGKLYRRLLQVQRPQRNTPATPSLVPGEEVQKLVAADRDTVKGCDWSIVHPRPGQVISPKKEVPIEFDLSRLDPGLPAVGSLFETVPGCRDMPATSATNQGGHDIGVDSATDECGVENGLGVIVCSYLEGYDPAHCLPRGDMLGVSPGWHVLTAEVYQLPGLRPFSCPGDDGVESEKYSTRTVRFCVGDTVTCDEEEDDDDDEKHATTHVETPPRLLDEYSTPHPPRTIPVPSSPADEKEHGSTAEALPQLQAAPISQKERNLSPPDVELPFCFMTLALNAMPFITHHEPTFRRVGEILSMRADATAADLRKNASTNFHDPEAVDISPTPPPEAFWEWHVVEGVAVGRADNNSPYSRRRIPQRYFDAVTGLSVDGTTEYLDDLIRGGGNGLRRVRVHRRCEEEGRGRGGHHRGARGGETTILGKKTSASAGDTTTAAAAADKCSFDETGDGDNGGGGGGGGGGGDGGEGRSSCLWRDKIQMTNAVAFALEEECLLVQVDADELWTPAQLVELRDMFLLERNGGGNNQSDPPARGSPKQAPISSTNDGKFPAGHTADTGLAETHSSVSLADVNPRETSGAGIRAVGDYGDDRPLQQTAEQQAGRNRVCAYFDCHFFVGSDLVTVTEDGWGHSTSHEWLRAWVFRPRQSLWLRHAPPELARHDDTLGWELLKGEACIGRDETRRRGLVFTHYAYVLEEQVRFKSEFYGHSEAYSTEIPGRNIDGTPATDAVAEWKALQDAPAPVLLADHLSWLRVHGQNQDPRLLTTVADRPASVIRRSDNVLPVVPLAPFLRQIDKKGERKGSMDLAVQYKFEQGYKDGFSSNYSGLSSSISGSGGRRDNDGRRSGKSWESSITHETNTRLEGRRHRRGKRRARGDSKASDAKCGSLHLVVDGVVFQVDAVKPKGISRVWANVLPEMLTRLGSFEGTCLTFLVRGLASFPRPVEEAFHGLPQDRFSVARVPLYSPRFGFVSDELMLSWVVRNVGATAFVSTLYTRPFRATTPNVLHLLLIHDLLPEVLGWDTSKGEWLQKVKAVASASAVVTVSQYSAKEFLRIYPADAPPSTSVVGGGGGGDDGGSSNSHRYPPIPARPVWAASNGVDTAVFRPVYGVDGESKGKEAFRRAVGLDPGVSYVMIVGNRLGYKNAITAYRALGFASPANLALVIVGGGPITPQEAELLSGVRTWTHVGAGSSPRVSSGVPASSFDKPTAAVVAEVGDELLAAGYSGAVALLHLSIAEGFGLTVLEAFACGCPVVAADIPPVREIAGLPEQQIAQTATSNQFLRPRANNARVSAAHEEEQPVTWTTSEHAAPAELAHTATTSTRYNGAASPLEGGLVLVDDPGSATQVWRAVRGLLVMDVARRAVVSEALVRRAKAFGSWRPLADALVKAAVE